MDLAHGISHLLLHIIIFIYIIIFLFQSASISLIVYFPLKPMAYAFHITGQLFHVLKGLFYNPLASYSH